MFTPEDAVSTLLLYFSNDVLPKFVSAVYHNVGASPSDPVLGGPGHSHEVPQFVLESLGARDSGGELEEDHFVVAGEACPVQAVHVWDLDATDLDPSAPSVCHDVHVYLRRQRTGRRTSLSLDTWGQGILEDLAQCHHSVELLRQAELLREIFQIIFEPLELNQQGIE